MLSQDNGLREVCHAIKYEFKVALVYPLKAKLANYVIDFITNILLSIITIFLNLTTFVNFRSSNHFQMKYIIC